MIFRAAPSARHCITASSVFFNVEQPRKIRFPLNVTELSGKQPFSPLFTSSSKKSGKLNENFCRTGTQCILKSDYLFIFASQRRSCVWPHFLFQCVQAKAREAGLWNLFLPSASGLSQLDYAFIAEETGRVVFAPEVFNCQAPGETSHTSGSF